MSDVDVTPTGARGEHHGWGRAAAICEIEDTRALLLLRSLLRCTAHALLCWSNERGPWLGRWRRSWRRRRRGRDHLPTSSTRADDERLCLLVCVAGAAVVFFTLLSWGWVGVFQESYEGAQESVYCIRNTETVAASLTSFLHGLPRFEHLFADCHPTSRPTHASSRLHLPPP
ncbi:uncharacterized protein K452DRAFT_24231 [Aplosporella prunicola CBS 121167]|uniref:Uncharacterized protein n=1 Tax=Aplosporella prunicola CBS 121167 TaxID=1176127 RepID=A0A6A6BF91_9PEZI|nr:uncharacterized protein K452DRAFT_24231 [Aplosporella prunicola CBS 121167]KAF2141975.1 hypothetical protein K452DRAFT_24231 [Aplosporella prunicola CBS 121167]